MANPNQVLLDALEALATAAEHRDNTMGDPCRLIECKAALAAAAKRAREVLRDQQEAT